MSNYLNGLRNKAKELANGCPLMDGREKGNADKYVGKKLTVTDAFRMNGDNGNYYVFTVSEAPEMFFMSGGALTAIFDEAYAVSEREGVTLAEVCGGLEFSFGQKVKTRNGRDFRPVHIY